MNKIRNLWLAVFLVGIMFGTSLATGVSLTLNPSSITKYDGTAATATYLEFVFGSFKPYTTTSPYRTVATGDIIEEKNHNFSTDGAYQKIVTERNNAACNWRVWDGSPGYGETYFYGTGGGQTSGDGLFYSEYSPSLVLRYRAFKPYNATIASIEVGTVNNYDGTSTAPVGSSRKLLFKWKHNIPTTSPDLGKTAEVDQILWKVWKSTDAEPTTPTTTTPGDTNAGNKVVLNAEAAIYNAKVALSNGWGTTDYSATYSINVSGGDVMGGVITVNLKRKVGGPGINSFSVPAASFSISGASKNGVAVPSLTNNSASNALGLVKAINEINGGPLVRTFGYWDADLQSAVGVIVEYDGSSNITTASESQLTGILLSKDLGYQVYLRPDTEPTVQTIITFTMQ